jgi:hypothetical protein
LAIVPALILARESFIVVSETAESAEPLIAALSYRHTGPMFRHDMKTGTSHGEARTRFLGQIHEIASGKIAY